MIFKTKNFNIEISFYFLAIISLILSTNSSIITFYFFIAIIIHELGHLLAILYYKVKINKISFKIYGINIEIDHNKYLSIYSDIIILFSGPFANFFSAMIFKHLNLLPLAIVNLVIGIFNLLPVDSLDGGKISNIVLFSIFSMKTAYNISLIISILFITLFSIINFFL